jgi:cell division protease FtsH
MAAAAALVPAAAAKAADDAQGVASSRMSYSRFLEYLDMGRVKKVRGRDKHGLIVVS